MIPEEWLNDPHAMSILFEELPVTVMVYDCSNAIITTIENKRVEGYVPSFKPLMPLTTVLAYVLPQYHKPVTEAIEKCRTTTNRQYKEQLEYEAIDLQQNINKVLLTIRPFLWSDSGDVTQILLISQNISPLYIAKVEASEATSQLNTLLQTSMAGVWEFHVPSNMLYVHSTIMETVGEHSGVNKAYTLDTILDTIHVDDVPIFWKTTDALAQNTIDIIDMELRFSVSGLWCWLQLTGKVTKRNEKNEILECRGVAVNNTRLRQAMELTEEKTALLKAILNALPDLQLHMNIDGIVLDAFSSGETDQEMRLSGSELIGRDVSDIFPQEVAQPFRTNLRAAIEQQEKKIMEYSLLSPMGTEYFEARLSAINYLEAIVIIRNLSDLRLAETNLNTTISELALNKRELNKYIDSNDELERFAYIVSHDLQEPVRTMLTFSQLLLKRSEKWQLPTDALEFLEFIEKGARRMNQLILDLLTYSRVSTREFDMESIDLPALFTEIEEVLAEKKQKAKAIINYNQIPATLWGNRTKIKQLFQNLMANALKFRKENTSTQIQVRCAKNKNFYTFEVQDNGIGIEEEFQDTVFELFKKLHGNHVYDGTGLGLAICKRVVQQHNGDIWVTSKLNEGSTFFIKLPINE